MMFKTILGTQNTIVPLEDIIGHNLSRNCARVSVKTSSNLEDSLINPMSFKK